jgi:hypothetical protein
MIKENVWVTTSSFVNITLPVAMIYLMIVCAQHG